MYRRLIVALLLSSFIVSGQGLSSLLERAAQELVRKPEGELILSHLKAGDTSGASKLLNELAVKQAFSSGGGLDKVDPADLTRLSNELETQNAEQAALTGRQLRVAMLMLSAPEADDVTIKALETVTGNKSRVAFVSTQVKGFVDGFAAGAQMSEEERRLLIQNSPGGDKWLQTAPEKRRFIIGTREDEAAIRRYIEVQEQEGNTCFFYLLCEDEMGELCEERVVGAFMQTAGRVDVALSPRARRRSNVMREIDASQGLRDGEFAMLLISPQDLLRSAEQVGTRILISQMQNSN